MSAGFPLFLTRFEGESGSEFDRRRASNPRYSLRAYARTLEIEPSALSQILRGKRRLSPQIAERCSRRLRLSEELRRKLIGQKAVAEKGRSFREIDLDAFRLIADWHHFAILELIQVSGFRGNLAWIAGQLGTTEREVSEAVDRLVRVGYLEIHPDTAQWVDRSGDVTTVAHHRLTNEALKKLQTQILRQSLQSLSKTPLERRDHSSITMAIDPAKLPGKEAHGGGKYEIVDQSISNEIARLSRSVLADLREWKESGLSTDDLGRFEELVNRVFRGDVEIEVLSGPLYADWDVLKRHPRTMLNDPIGQRLKVDRFDWLDAHGNALILKPLVFHELLGLLELEQDQQTTFSVPYAEWLRIRRH